MTNGHMDAKVLRRAAEIVEVPDGWCQGEYARTEQGVSCDPLAGFAARWCLLGAVARARREVFGAGQPESLGMLNTGQLVALQKSLGAFIVYDWNDMPERTADEVAAALRAAADRCDSASPEPIRSATPHEDPKVSGGA